MHTIGYLPLDDRPVCVDRARYLAHTANCRLLMPDKALYTCRLDGQPRPLITHHERINALRHWLLTAAESCDALVVSADMLLSGGLVNSRSLDDEELTQECLALQALRDISHKMPVYVFDTIMRLTPTVGYRGVTLSDYEALRSYGAIVRKPLSGKALTLDNIIAGYAFDAHGTPIPPPLSEPLMTRYHKARARQLKLNDYLLNSLRGSYHALWVGVDDSMPHDTIQTNEINYLTPHLGANGLLLSGTDELGLLCLARCCLAFNRCAVSVTPFYFGGGEDAPADEYDTGTLRRCVDNHITALTDNTPNGTPLQLLILTASATDDDRNALQHKLSANLDSQIPTAVVDVSGQPQLLFNTLLRRQIPLLKLHGYSSWNTAANATGIALAQAAARMATPASTAAQDIAHAQALTFAFVKDVCYKAAAASIVAAVRQQLGDPLNFYHELTARGLTLENANALLASSFTAYDGPCSLAEILQAVSTPDHAITIDNFYFPMYRTFEIGFDIHC